MRKISSPQELHIFPYMLVYMIFILSYAVIIKYSRVGGLADLNSFLFPFF